jgi:hypothetical protein
MHRTFVTVSVLLSAIAVNASPYQVSALRRAVVDIPGYESLGCYTEATGKRALSGKIYLDDLMDSQKCAAACEGYNFFGLEYGTEVGWEKFLVLILWNTV